MQRCGPRRVLRSRSGSSFYGGMRRSRCGPRIAAKGTASLALRTLYLHNPEHVGPLETFQGLRMTYVRKLSHVLERGTCEGLCMRYVSPAAPPATVASEVATARSSSA